ncbi:MAG: hypothetical protein OJJ21_14155 [Ferrovibrio sp.]|uniref:hypothetical protein n=1 Tax=Ferrovibrio sp. TaxID=1917215 RepID=UPI00262C96CF|nr:hypothetical protein [Ferrovibrio sp.]MCW0234738.1 hypothetical protein [Ferrovibrio sp.]
MSSLKVVKGTLQVTGEYETSKHGRTNWTFWRIEDENGRDVMLKQVSAGELMRSHAFPGTEATFVFTNDPSPTFIGMKYSDGRIAESWDEWNKGRKTVLKVFIFGLLLFLPAVLAILLGGKGELMGLVVAVTIVACGLTFFGGLGCLAILFSAKPTKEQLTAALNG